MTLYLNGLKVEPELTLSNTGLHILDSNGTHDLIIKPGSDLTADRELTLTTGDAARTVTLSGNPTLADWFDQSVKQAASPTFAGLDLTEGNITNVGDISLDSITSDGSTITIGGTPSIVLTDGTTVAVTLGNDAGDDFTIDTSAFVVEGDTGNVGISTTGPAGKLQIGDFSAGEPTYPGYVRIISVGNGPEVANNGLEFGNSLSLNGYGYKLFTNNSSDYFGIATRYNSATWTERLVVNQLNGNVGIGTTGPDSKLHIDQASTTAAIPVMTLDQADLSEQFFRFMTTIGVGNPIEAVGAKTLTTTHFIRVEIDGVGDRYLPVGTIA